MYATSMAIVVTRRLLVVWACFAFTVGNRDISPRSGHSVYRPELEVSLDVGVQGRTERRLRLEVLSSPAKGEEGSLTGRNIWW